MEWTDEAIVLGLRRQGETSVVLELMTRSHGRHLGLVHGGRSRRMQPILQAGNGVHAVWRARLDEQLGSFVVEAGPARAARYLGSAMALYGLATLVAHLRLLPDRDPHPTLFETATILADNLPQPEVAPALFVRFEVMVLAELGFGLDLGRCAVTERSDDLAYVSPRTGRAVGAEAGAPYRDRLFTLPAFLRPGSPGGQPDAAEIAAGFAITGHFLDANVYDPRGQTAPDARTRFIGLAVDAAGAVTARDM